MGRKSKPYYNDVRKQWQSTIAGDFHVLARGPERETKRAAEKRHRELMVEVDRRKPRILTAEFSLDRLAASFLDEAERTLVPETCRHYLVVVRSFTLTTGRDTAAAEVRPLHVSQWLAAQSWSQSTQGSRVGIIKRMFEWGRKAGHLEANPIRDAERPRAVGKRVVMTEELAARFFETIPDQPFRDFVLALRETGCRPGEVAGLTVERVDLEARTWKVLNKTRRKTGVEYRTVYLSDAAIELTRRLIEGRNEGAVFRNSNGKPWQPITWVQRFRRLGEKLGFGKECTAYSYRHLWITRALMNDLPPATVAELAGHSSLDMIMKIYLQLKNQTDHLREAARRAAG